MEQFLERVVGIAEAASTVGVQQLGENLAWFIWAGGGVLARRRSCCSSRPGVSLRRPSAVLVEVVFVGVTTRRLVALHQVLRVVAKEEASIFNGVRCPKFTVPSLVLVVFGGFVLTLTILL